MMGSQRSKRGPAGALLWLSTLFVGFALSGCIFSPDKKDDDPPVVVPYPAATGPREVLEIIKRSYEERNIDEFEKVFAEAYVFEFSPDDVGQGNTPATWLRNDEIDSARNMFADETVDGIQVSSFIIPPPRAAVESDNLDIPIEGVQVITIDEVRLSVFTRNEQGEVLELLVPGEQAVFFFLKTEEVDPGSGQKLWELIRWRDKPTGSFAAIKQTFATN